jgi:ribulose-phosphate 3-epimerase
MITIAPAILARDPDAFIERVRALNSQAILVQLDVLNNSLVVGETVADPALIHSLKTSLKFEIHLMVDLTTYDIAQWNRSWVESIIVHCESKGHQEALGMIHSWGKRAFLGINPDTSIELLEKPLGACDGVMFMTVAPGAMGNEFRHDVVERIAKFHQTHPEVTIEVDGGVTPTSIKQLMNAGATRFAVGSFVDSAHVADRLAELTFAAQ